MGYAWLVFFKTSKLIILVPVNQEVLSGKREHELGVPGIPVLQNFQVQVECLPPWVMSITLDL